MNFAYLMLKYLFHIYPLLGGQGEGCQEECLSLMESISVYILITFLTLLFLYENRLS